MTRKEIEDSLTDMAAYLNENYCPEGCGFALLMFPYEDDKGDIVYVSTARREDMIPNLRKFLQHLGGDN